MNLRMMHDQLVRQIQKFGQDSREHRQVYKRLNQLLPDRMKELASRHRVKGLGASESDRQALVSDEFVAHLQEISHVGALSMAARIQFETHLMLIDARQSLRAASLKNSFKNSFKKSL
jgi:hypothetical protein